MAQSSSKKQTQTTERKPIDIKSRRTRPVPVGDSTGYALVGDVVLYHNGSVITCDSVVRYSDRQMSCYGNVIIKKDDTYIYGDRAEYSRDEGMARVYSPLIKVYNGNSTLYTYNLLFDTENNIGEFYGGGTFTNGTNLMESEKGYFYADLDEMVGVDNVELKNETYMLKSDSVNYNSETEVARYFTRSVTWKDGGEILSSDEGEYHNKEERYIFRSNAYVMGEKQEMWADTIDYKSLIEFIELKHNGQIRDEEHQSIIFGDYGKNVVYKASRVVPAILDTMTRSSPRIPRLSPMAMATAMEWAIRSICARIRCLCTWSTRSATAPSQGPTRQLWQQSWKQRPSVFATRLWPTVWPK